MKINQKRIRNLERHLPATFQNRRIYIGLSDLQEFGAKLNAIGFTANLNIGETVLPSVVGPVTRLTPKGKTSSAAICQRKRFTAKLNGIGLNGTVIGKLNKLISAATIGARETVPNKLPSTTVRLDV